MTRIIFAPSKGHLEFQKLLNQGRGTLREPLLAYLANLLELSASPQKIGENRFRRARLGFEDGKLSTRTLKQLRGLPPTFDRRSVNHGVIAHPRRVDD